MMLRFSLLPDELIPYYRFTIASFMQVCHRVLKPETPAEDIVQEIMDSFDPEYNFNYEVRYLPDVLDLFEQTIFKLRQFLNSQNQDITFLLGKEMLVNGWRYLSDFSDDSGLYRSATGFSRFSYEKQGGYHRNPRFLFGTAYQFLVNIPE